MRLVFSQLCSCIRPTPSDAVFLDDTPENVISSKCHPDSTDLSDSPGDGSDMQALWKSWSCPMLQPRAPFSTSHLLQTEHATLEQTASIERKTTLELFPPSGMRESIYTPGIPLIKVWKSFSGGNLLFFFGCAFLSQPCLATWLFSSQQTMCLSFCTVLDDGPQLSGWYPCALQGYSSCALRQAVIW